MYNSTPWYIFMNSMSKSLFYEQQFLSTEVMNYLTSKNSLGLMHKVRTIIRIFSFNLAQLLPDPKKATNTEVEMNT